MLLAHLPPIFKHRPRSLNVTSFTTQESLPTLHRQSDGGDDSGLLLLRLLSHRSFPRARLLLDTMPPGPTNVVTWTAILTRYAQQGFIDEARSLFELMPERNIVTWNSMLSAYVSAGRISEAICLFEEMPQRNVVSFTSMLCGLARFGRIDQAKRMFDMMPERNVVSWNSMISGLVKNNEVDEAQDLFNKMPERNLVSWNVMISGYAENLRIEEARWLFNKMMGHANVVTWTSLVAGYCRIGDIEGAYNLFMQMPERNIISWTAMIGGFSWNGFYKEALRLFLEMKEIGEVKPNDETFVSLFYACAGLGFDKIGRQLHGHLILSELSIDMYNGKLIRSLVHMYSRFGMMDTAKYLFDKKSIECETVLLNSMINGYVQVGELEKARHLFNTISTRDKRSWTSIITGYFHEGNVEEAVHLFHQMPSADAVSWTVMVSGHVQNELFLEAFELFFQMQFSGVRPLDSTYSTLLGAVGAMASLELGQQLHCQVSKMWLQSDLILNNALISMYAKSGDIDGAHRIFDSMITRDVISWNSMIIGFSHHGLTNEALELFNLMKDTSIRPNSVTLLGILSACSHAGLTNQGWEFFNTMTKQYSIQPDAGHYICMIDLLGRAGKVAEAEEFVRRLPFEPGPAVWGALLGVCSIGDRNVAVGRRAARQALEFDPLNAPAHVLLCNIYAASGLHMEEEMTRKAMGVKGVRKFPGCSWILLKGRAHVFLSGDRSHPQCGEIFSLLGYQVH